MLFPLRVAIIGSGPSAFYAAEPLLKAGALVTMIERLPTPFGLVRGGVAPDHPKIKSVTKVYERTAAHQNFRYYGGVEFGKHITLADLQTMFHAVIFATGAQTDRRMGIAGEDLPGSHPATEFVAWYNGHPDYQHLSFDLTQKAAVVVGNGNVAMDVARILARTPEELATTDITDSALEALRHSQIETIYILGRRGPAQAAYTTPEIKELGELAAASVTAPADEAALDDLSAEWLHHYGDRGTRENVEIVQAYAAGPASTKPRRIVLRFLVSPTRIIGTERVEGVEIVRNTLVQAADGSLRPQSSGQTEIIPAGLVFRSIGYKGVALPDVPFDSQRGVIPNVLGRVTETDGTPVIGQYVAGWIKRGPSGVIGTNKPDSAETAASLLEDAETGALWQPTHTTADALDSLLSSRGVDVVSFADWQAVDALEQSRGAAQSRPRVKLTRVADMMTVVHAARGAKLAAD
ncbi:MAG: FAD-dependent oxidoreductase [Pleurocapsa minor GSE-CHR-MK-17-07R]|jgi:ferredoxin--NADP+ reductase|nr:FAD-dependent oxidoreductase [Pleurocapsa minor GSE-CHR-MK 17-07R]